MNTEQTRQLLAARSALTAERYGDLTVEAWHAVLAKWPFHECRAALGTAAKTHTEITPAHLVALLPDREHVTEYHEPNRIAQTDEQRARAHARIDAARTHNAEHVGKMPNGMPVPHYRDDCPICRPLAAKVVQR